MNATQEERYRQAIAVPLAYLGANYGDREGWLSVAELRRYAWGEDVPLPDMYKVLRRVAATVIHDRVRWVGPDGEQPTGKGVRLRRLLQKRLWIFRFVPFVRMVGLMNSVAAGCAAEGSDIDIFVVTRAGRIWTARAMTLMALTVLGWRSRVRNKAGKLSVDLFLAEDGLDLERAGVPTDYLTAYWLADFTPILYPERFKDLWAENRWVKRCLPVAYRSPRKWDGDFDVRPSGLAKLTEWMLSGSLGAGLEARLKTWQTKKIGQNVEKFTADSSSRGLVLVTDSVIKIHFDDSKRDRINRAIEHALAS